MSSLRNYLICGMQDMEDLFSPFAIDKLLKLNFREVL